MEMHVEPVTSLAQIEAVRIIYNDNLESLATKPLPRRLYHEQIKWWLELDKSKVRLWLHYDTAGYRLIGFSMLTARGDCHTPIFAIRKEEQGLGYARHFIEHYLKAAGTPLRGEQLRSNEAIVYLNAEYGWEVLASYNGVDDLYHPGVK
jgi:GNAT superfamily N-acetyltransferase